MQYEVVRRKENDKAQESLADGDVDDSDIITMVFDIFSSRKKFVFAKINLYFGFLGPVL